jgi:site-specific recombinase XerC
MPQCNAAMIQRNRENPDRVTALGLRPEEYATHSLRRTKASMICKATGNIRVIQILLGHSKIENTV